MRRQSCPWPGSAPTTSPIPLECLGGLREAEIPPHPFPAGVFQLALMKTKGTNWRLILLCHIWLRLAEGSEIHWGGVGRHRHCPSASFSFRANRVRRWLCQWPGQHTPAGNPFSKRERWGWEHWESSMSVAFWFSTTHFKYSWRSRRPWLQPGWSCSPEAMGWWKSAPKSLRLQQEVHRWSLCFPKNFWLCERWSVHPMSPIWAGFEGAVGHSPLPGSALGWALWLKGLYPFSVCTCSQCKPAFHTGRWDATRTRVEVNDKQVVKEVSLKGRIIFKGVEIEKKQYFWRSNVIQKWDKKVFYMTQYSGIFNLWKEEQYFQGNFLVGLFFQSLFFLIYW